MNVLDADKFKEVRKRTRAAFKFRFLPNGKVGLRDLADTCVAQFDSLDELEAVMTGVPKADTPPSANRRPSVVESEKGVIAMWYRVESDKSGAIVSCTEAESKAKWGGLIAYVDADTKQQAVILAKQQFERWLAGRVRNRNMPWAREKISCVDGVRDMTIHEARNYYDSIVTALDNPEVSTEDIAIAVVALKDFQEKFLAAALNVLEIFEASEVDPR